MTHLLPSKWNGIAALPYHWTNMGMYVQQALKGCSAAGVLPGGGASELILILARLYPWWGLAP